MEIFYVKVFSTDVVDKETDGNIYKIGIFKYFVTVDFLSFYSQQLREQLDKTRVDINNIDFATNIVF